MAIKVQVHLVKYVPKSRPSGRDVEGVIPGTGSEEDARSVEVMVCLACSSLLATVECLDNQHFPGSL